MKSMTEIDWVRLCADIVRIAEENPHHVAEDSCYFDEKTKVPVCLIGNALASQGFTYDDVYILNSGKIHLFPVADADIPYQAWCHAVQRRQDLGFPWGQAIVVGKP